MAVDPADDRVPVQRTDGKKVVDRQQVRLMWPLLTAAHASDPGQDPGGWALRLPSLQELAHPRSVTLPPAQRACREPAEAAILLYPPASDRSNADPMRVVPAQPTLRTADALAEAGLIEPSMRDAVAAVERRYAVAITPAMHALIEQPDDPIGRQFIPDPAELITAPHESPDPIADDALSPIKGVVHRYPDRALLKPLLVCPVYCRFCFRREHVGPDGGVLTEAELQAAYAWFAARPAIREVILTGGDPLMLSPRRLGAIVAALAAIPHIETAARAHARAGGRSGAG